MNTVPSVDMLPSQRDQGGKGASQVGVKMCWAEDEQPLLAKDSSTA